RTDNRKTKERERTIVEKEARGRIEKRQSIDQKDQHESANQPVTMVRDVRQTIPKDEYCPEAADRHQHLGLVDLQAEKKRERHGRSNDEPRGVRRDALARWRRKHGCVESRHLQYNAQAIGTVGSVCCTSIT